MPQLADDVVKLQGDVATLAKSATTVENPEDPSTCARRSEVRGRKSGRVLKIHDHDHRLLQYGDKEVTALVKNLVEDVIQNITDRYGAREPLVSKPTS
jgi:hypothetical protein